MPRYDPPMPTFKLDELDKLEVWLKSRTADGLRRGLVSAAYRTLGVIQNELIPAEKPQPVDRGAFRAGWKVETTERGADIVNSLPYASVIDKSARAESVKIGRAMIQALAEWARRKGFAPAGVPVGRSDPKDPDKAYESIAWAIAVSMKRRGIFQRDGVSGLQIAAKAVARLKGYLQEEIAREINRR
jgi:hypothetical protein